MKIVLTSIMLCTGLFTLTLALISIEYFQVAVLPGPVPIGEVGPDGTTGAKLGNSSATIGPIVLAAASPIMLISSFGVIALLSTGPVMVPVEESSGALKTFVVLSYGMVVVVTNPSKSGEYGGGKDSRITTGLVAGLYGRTTSDSSDGGFAMFYVTSNEAGAEECASGIVEEYKSKMPGAVITPLNHWGKHEGNGIALEGKMLQVEASARVVTIHQGRTWVVVVEFVPEEDAAKIDRDLRVISDSFEFVKN
ncbi:MAG: hypothetical protein JSS27_11855 [Planctomycetes bacterium]|nr:hypothetical protein [Planctomycetota bacterium]